MKRCSICNNPEGTWTYEDSGFGGTRTAVFYLCKACDKSRHRALASGTHVPSALWVIKRMHSTRVKQLKFEIEHQKRSVESLRRLCQSYVMKLKELEGKETNKCTTTITP